MKVESASSLFEMMFGINAVFTFLYVQYLKNIDAVYQHVLNEAEKKQVSIDPRLDKFRRDSAYKLFKNFRRRNKRRFYFSFTLSILGTLIPIYLLTMSAVTPDFDISESFFFALIGVFLILSPIASMYFYIKSEKALQQIRSQKISDEILQNVESTALIKQIGEDTERIAAETIIDVKKINLQRRISELKNIVTKKLNPMHHYKERKWKRSIESLSKDESVEKQKNCTGEH